MDARSLYIAALIDVGARVERQPAPSRDTITAAREAAASLRSYAEDVADQIEGACDYAEYANSPQARAEERTRFRAEME